MKKEIVYTVKFICGEFVAHSRSSYVDIYYRTFSAKDKASIFDFMCFISNHYRKLGFDVSFVMYCD